MNNANVELIPITDLLWMFIPVALVAAVFYSWSTDYRNVLTATVRMLVQLFLIGYALSYLFRIETAAPIILILLFMLTVSTWISLRPLKNKSWPLFARMAVALAAGGIVNLMLVILVLDFEPWFSATYIIPLGGMILYNAMNTVCLAAERFESEIGNGIEYRTARNTALMAGMIPVINMLVAVGVVTLPGVMTGQILSGVSPLVAVRYQVMIMCMVLNASAIATICYLALVNPDIKWTSWLARKDSRR